MESRAEFLADLEATEGVPDRTDPLLWPRTPIGDEIQEKIRARVGVSDREPADPNSRPARIVALTDRLRRSGHIPERFSALDIACGDGLVLLALKNRFPPAECYGVDLNVDGFPAHAAVRSAGITLRKVLIQDLFESPAPAPFDLVMMLNTYRGWESADLSDSDRELPQRCDLWLRANARFIVLTATTSQLFDWWKAGYRIADLGRGEDDSRLVCLSHYRFAGGVQAALRSWRVRFGR